MAYNTEESTPINDVANPAEQTQALLHQARREMETHRGPIESETREIINSISKAAARLSQIGDLDPSVPDCLGAVTSAMNQLRDVLGSLQIISQDNAALEGTAQLIAKSLAILYPLSKFGESRVPASPAPSESLPPQIRERRKARRISIGRNWVPIRHQFLHGIFRGCFHGRSLHRVIRLMLTDILIQVAPPKY